MSNTNTIERIPTAGMSREAWLAERKLALGGSDMGAILGLNAYRSAVNVWADKLGLIEGTEDNEAMRIGRDLEGYVAQRFAEVSGKKVQAYNYLLRDNEHHLSANIDRRVLGEQSGLECKTASALSEGRYKGGCYPESYYAQCVSYLAVTGWTRWYLCAVVLGRGVYIYMMTTDPNDTCPEWCESMVYVSPDELQAVRDAAKDWWEAYIIPRQMPPTDGSASTTATLGNLYQAADDPDKADLSNMVPDVAAYLALKARAKELDTQADAIKQALMATMGNRSKAICPGYSISWSAQNRTTLDRKALQKDHPELDLEPYLKTSTSRTFRCAQKEDK